MRVGDLEALVGREKVAHARLTRDVGGIAFHLVLGNGVRDGDAALLCVQIAKGAAPTIARVELLAFGRDAVRHEVNRDFARTRAVLVVLVIPGLGHLNGDLLVLVVVLVLVFVPVLLLGVLRLGGIGRVDVGQVGHGRHRRCRSGRGNGYGDWDGNRDDGAAILLEDVHQVIRGDIGVRFALLHLVAVSPADRNVVVDLVFGDGVDDLIAVLVVARQWHLVAVRIGHVVEGPLPLAHLVRPAILHALNLARFDNGVASEQVDGYVVGTLVVLVVVIDPRLLAMDDQSGLALLPLVGDDGKPRLVHLVSHRIVDRLRGGANLNVKAHRTLAVLARLHDVALRVHLADAIVLVADGGHGVEARLPLVAGVKLHRLDRVPYLGTTRGRILALQHGARACGHVLPGRVHVPFLLHRIGLLLGVDDHDLGHAGLDGPKRRVVVVYGIAGLLQRGEVEHRALSVVVLRQGKGATRHHRPIVHRALGNNELPRIDRLDARRVLDWRLNQAKRF